MKVEALTHVQQKIGSLTVERVQGTHFDLNDNDAVAGEAAGIVKIIEGKPLHNANNRLTKVEKKMEKK
jgi:hypothetical protein